MAITKEELSTERLILVALMKAVSEQSTYLTGTMKFQFKQDFNNLIKRMDDIINQIETQVTENQQEYLQKITDIYHNMNLEVRNNLNTEYKKLSELV